MITYTWCMEVEYVLLDGVRKYDQTLWLTCIYFLLQKFLLSFVHSFSIKGGLPKFRVKIMLKIMCQMYFALWPTKTNVISIT